MNERLGPVDHDNHALQDAVWRRVELARHPQRPHALELLRAMGANLIELHGDRKFGDDPAIVGGFATIGDHRVVFVGNQKGRDTEENIRRNFGMAHPEGYRKAGLMFDRAERFGLPVVTFIDTPGADPGVESEERGQAVAIAESIRRMITIRTPIVSVIIGEGGSGGALAIAVGDVVLALENSIYSVISPEGCAEILWKSKEARKKAAVALRLIAQEQQALGVIDEIIPEPEGGAQNDLSATAINLRSSIIAQLNSLSTISVDRLVESRYVRYRNMGTFIDVNAPVPRPHGMLERIRNILHLG